MYLKKTPGFLSKFFPSILWNSDSDERLRLSFDDGPNPDSTPQILAALDKKNIKASFFCLGEQVKKYPQIFDSISQKGHLIGSHGFKHLSGWKTSSKEYLRNVELGREYIESEYYRPPYGRMTISQFQKLNKDYKIVMWDVMPGDFDPSVNKATVLHNIKKKAKSNSIIVLHDSPSSLEKVTYVLDQNIF